jgi:anti-sigma regulatory factor (Ser/Thr protein kinase)
MVQAAQVCVPSTQNGSSTLSAADFHTIHLTRFPIRFCWAFPARTRSVCIADPAGDGGSPRAREVRASSTVLLPHTPASAALARRRLTAELLRAGIREPAAHDAALVMSELLSNALLHAHPLPDGHVRVGWVLDGSTLEVTVSDGGAVTRPRASRPSLSSLGGRGLSIVTDLTWRWGVRTTDDGGTTVWALLQLPPVNGHGNGGVAQRQSGDTHSDMTVRPQSEGSGGDCEPHPRRGQRGRSARHGPAAPSGCGTPADNPAK